MFWDNAYPLEVQFNPAPSLSFRAMGGSGVFHILSGPTPADVIKQMTEEIIGLPQMPRLPHLPHLPRGCAFRVRLSILV